MSIDRLLSILLLLSKKDLITGKELAEHFEVSIRTIYRDIDKIGQAGIPIAAIGGKGGGFYIMEDYRLENLALNNNEIHTVMAVMNGLKDMFGKNQHFNDIVLKFQNTYKKESDKTYKLDLKISHFSMEDELKEYVYIINKGIEESKLLQINYINRNMEFTVRMVEPIRIEFSYGQWYLTGFCRKRNDYRKFKLVRIKNLKLGDNFIKRLISEEELEEIFNKSYVKKSVKIKLKFSNKIGNQLTEYFMKDSISKDEEGSFIVEDYFPYEESLIKFILGFGSECEIIEPENLRKDTKKYLEKILETYND